MQRHMGSLRRSGATTALLNQQGVDVVALLLALLIAAALYFGYFKSQNTRGERSLGISAIDASKSVACRANRQNIERAIALWVVSHADEAPTLAALQKDGLRLPSCPEGGHYDIVQREVRCSVHN